MVSFLLTWNPRRSIRGDQRELITQLESGQAATSRWGIRTKAIAAGDQLFFIRLGVPPKGIFGRGTAISDSYRDDHWDAEKRAEGKTTLFVNVQFAELIDTSLHPPLPLEELAVPPLNEINWLAQGSGHFIPEKVASALSWRWDVYYKKAGG